MDWLYLLKLQAGLYVSFLASRMNHQVRSWDCPLLVRDNCRALVFFYYYIVYYMIFMVYYGAYLYYTMLYYLCYLMCVILYYAILWVKTYVFFLFLFLLMSFAAVHAWFQSLESQTKTSVVHPFQKVVYVHSNGVIHCTCMFYVLICTSILCSMKR